MRVFVTGATGFVGSATVKELIAAGHQVVGLVRSKEKAASLEATGAEIVLGSVDDLDGLRRTVDQADGVIHTAFNHDFSRYVQNCEDDRHVIEAIGSVLVGSDRPLIITSGTGMAQAKPGQAATEDDPTINSAVAPRAASEEAGNALLGKGVNVMAIRLPQVHDRTKAGLVSYAVTMAKEKGVSPYVGDGANRWSAGHVLDVARLYRLALEKGKPGAKYHAVGEEGVSTRAIAETIGKRLGVPARPIATEEAGAHFGWLAPFVTLDLSASSAKTRSELGWTATGPGLIDDLA